MSSTVNLVENVAEDNSLSPSEKETIVRWSKESSINHPDVGSTDAAWLYTEEAGIARRLLNNPVFTVEELRVNTDTAVGRRVDPESYSTGRITGVGGHIPVGAVKLQKGVRSSSGHASVVAYCNR
jgi:hypothetical protein